MFLLWCYMLHAVWHHTITLYIVHVAIVMSHDPWYMTSHYYIVHSACSYCDVTWFMLYNITMTSYIAHLTIVMSHVSCAWHHPIYSRLFIVPTISITCPRCMSYFSSPSLSASHVWHVCYILTPSFTISVTCPRCMSYFSSPSPSASHVWHVCYILTPSFTISITCLTCMLHFNLLLQHHMSDMYVTF